MGFFDLNIPYLESSPSNTAANACQKAVRIKIVVKAMELGYTGIAYNRTMKGVMSERDRCPIPLLTLSSLLKVAPSLSSSVNFHRDLLGVPQSSPFRQYTRLTVCVDNVPQCQALNSGNPILKSYDIVAATPLNQTAFDYTCEKAEVDIIAIDFSDRMPFRLKQPMVKAAVERGVYFEITYADLIVDVQVRRQLISNAKLLVDWTRGKNLIFSSAAPSVWEFRGPNDVANLASLLGVSTERARAAVSKNCRTLIANALRRKHFFKEIIRIEPISSSGKCDSGKLGSFDWLKWDPISSGDGDLILDDMVTSVSVSASASSKELKTVKAIDFSSDIDNMPSHGFQVKDLIFGTKAIDTLIRTDEMSEKSNTLDLLAKSKTTSFDNTTLELQTPIFMDSEKLENETTQCFSKTLDVRKFTTFTEKDLENPCVSDVVSASFQTEQQEQDLQLRKCISSCELNIVRSNENVTSLTSAIDIELHATKNADVELVAEKVDVDHLTVDTDMEDGEDGSLTLDNMSLHRNTLERKLPLNPGDEADITDRVSSLDSDQMTVDFSATSQEAQVEVIIVEHKHGEAANVKINQPSAAFSSVLYENAVEREPVTVAEIGHALTYKANDDLLSANYEAQHETSREGQKNTKADKKGNHPTPVLSDLSLHENVVEGKVISAAGGDAVVVEQISFMEADDLMKLKDKPSTVDYKVQMEEAAEKQKHVESDTKNDYPALIKDTTSGKPRARRRTSHQLPLFPFSRALRHRSFKKKARKPS
ncbi:hypothetical protein SLE2022_196800 [Rubroshorea leprosula]